MNLPTVWYCYEKQWCWRWGCKCTPKSFADLLKIWAKSLKILVKWRPMLFAIKIWHRRFTEKHMKTFFWSSHQKWFSWSLWEKICGQKFPKKLFWQVWGNSGKNPSHFQKFAYSYTYDEKAPSLPLPPFCKVGGGNAPALVDLQEKSSSYSF